MKHTEETKAQMSAKMTGKSNPNYGKTFSEEYRAKLSAAQTGRKHSEETKAKMRAKAKGNQNAKGYKQTEEHKRKLAEARDKRRQAKQAAAGGAK